MLANVVPIREDAGVDFASEGLLDGLEGKERTAREHLLQRLLDDGFSGDDLKKAVAENRLALLPVERVLGGSHSAAELEGSSGLPATDALRLRRVLGLPGPGRDDRVFSDEDVEAARSIKLFIDAGFDEERITEITRVLGEGMGRLSATIVAAFVETFLQAGESESDVAMRFADLAQELTPAFAPILVAGFKSHLRGSVARGMLSLEELQRGDTQGTQDVSVCFADLVGFTRLGGQVEVRELGSVAGRLATLASTLAEEPVRLVKTIGDAAMFVSTDSAPLVDVALALVEAFEQEELPSVRAGIACGPAVMQAGDFYGHSVNLASRVTGVARPGSVLCTREIRDAARDRFEWSAAGRHRLKGVSGHTPLFRARRLQGDGGSGQERSGNHDSGDGRSGDD